MNEKLLEKADKVLKDIIPNKGILNKKQCKNFLKLLKEAEKDPLINEIIEATENGYGVIMCIEKNKKSKVYRFIKN